MSNGATVKLDFNMQDIVAAAIFEKLDATKREELIKSALISLLEVERNQYGNQPSKLQRAFDNAVSDQAGKLVREMLEGESPEAIQVRGRIRELVVKAFDNLFKLENPDEIVEKLTKVITDVLTPKQRY